MHDEGLGNEAHQITEKTDSLNDEKSKEIVQCFHVTKKITIPSVGVSVEYVSPQFNIIRAEGDINFSHLPALLDLHDVSSKLPVLQQELKSLSSLKIILQILLQLKKLQGTIFRLSSDLEKNVPSARPGNDISIQVKNFSTSLEHLHESSLSTAAQIMELLDNLRWNFRSGEGLKAKLIELEDILKPPLCIVIKQIKTLVQQIINFAVTFHYPATKENFSISYRVYQFHLLLKYLQEISMNMNDIFQNSILQEKQKCDREVSRSMKEEVGYSASIFLKDLAEKRSVVTAKQLIYCIQKSLNQKYESHFDSTNEFSNLDANEKIEENGEQSFSKSKKMTKALRKEFSSLFAKENQFLVNIFQGFSDTDENSRKPIRLPSLNIKELNFTVMHSKSISWEMIKKQNSAMNKVYIDHLWNSTHKHIRNTTLHAIACFNESSHLCNFSLFKFHFDGIYNCITKCLKDPVPFSSVKVLSSVFLIVSSFHCMQQWDHGLCKAMSVLPKDKFRYSNENPSIPSSQTLLLLLRNHHQQKDILKYLKILLEKELILYVNCGFFFTNIQFNTLLPSFIFNSYLKLLTMSKRQQYLFSGNLEQFFVVSSGDLKLVENFLLHYEGLLQEHLAGQSSELDLLLNDLSNNSKEIKIDKKEGFELFFHLFRKRSRACVDLHMPTGKLWKKRVKNDDLYDPNHYIKVFVNTMFQPFLDSSNCLSDEERRETLLRCIEIFIRLWMEHILFHQIMFSWSGANQLQVDFEQFLLWFDSTYCAVTDKFRDEGQLTTIRSMRNALILLMCQPHGKRSSRSLSLANATMESLSNISEVSAECFTSNQFDQIIMEVDLHDKERWLALRVKTKDRRFLCLS